jgi:L-aspartate oxidase
MQNPIIVIGSGISGLNFALKVASRGLNVVVLTKKETAESGTNYAQGGIAAALDQFDSFAYRRHFKIRIVP